jgi:hypothetical protein
MLWLILAAYCKLQTLCVADAEEVCIVKAEFYINLLIFLDRFLLFVFLFFCNEPCPTLPLVATNILKPELPVDSKKG